ncbi:MAG: hypothetical protein JXP36_19035 [Bacteroidales bacterium]|nr:hypothetical protein [Bacteroidales bacterium]
MNISEPNNTEKKRPRSFFDSKEANNDDSKIRKENGVEDLNNLQQIKELPAQVQPSADDRMKQLFELRAEKPVYDPQRPEELRRLARNATVGKALSLIGDNIALAKNANVNRARPDNSEKEYQNKVYDYMDDYQRRLDTWNWRDFTNKLRNIQTAQDQGNWQKSFDQRQQNADRAFAYDISKDERNYKNDQEEFNRQLQLNYDKFKQTQEYQKMTAGERERHNRQLEAASLLRANNTVGNKTIKVQTDDGQTHTFSPEEASFIRNDALKNIDRLIKVYPHLFTTKETDELDLKTGNYKKEYILSKNTTDEDLIRAFLQLPKESEKKEWQIPEIWGGTSNTQTAKPKEKTTIDYSTLNY